jgi:hypothetical protein
MAAKPLPGSGGKLQRITELETIWE